MLPAIPWTQHAQFALLWIKTRRAAISTGKAWAKGHHGMEGLETHRAVSPARQDPEVVDFAVQLQPAGNRKGEEGRGEALQVLHSSCLTEPLAFTKPHPCLPPGAGGRALRRNPGTWMGRERCCPHQYSRLLGSTLAEVENLPWVEIPHEGLDDLGSL